jgi:glycosyltransferase involved in cell wall biosynthesis
VTLFCVAAVKKISIVIPAFNEERLIGQTLDAIKSSLGAFANRNWETELVVCDNNSKDRTAELARAAGATVIFEPINQIGRARNTGAAAAAGDWLVFVDADSQPSPQLFEQVARQIEGGRCLAGGSTVRLEGNYPTAKIVTALWNRVSRTFKLLAGSFIFVEAAAFKEVGGFGLEFFAAEEIELSKRLKRYLRQKGKKLVILHKHPMLTSARKMDLYQPHEHFRFLIRAVLFPGRTLRNRNACQPWYDGRR